MTDLLKVTHAAGHAFVTPGKQSPDGYKEWQYTNEIVKQVIEELSHYENVAQKRIDDPSGKVDISLSKRVQEINDWGALVHIDYHLNAYGNGWTSPGGTETYVHSTKPKEALALAQKVQANLVKELGFANRGVKAANFQMLRETSMTAILPEIAFMTNKNEAMKMRTADYQKKAAKAIVDALVAHYGLKKKPAPKPAAKPSTSGKLYKVQVGAFADKKNAENLASDLKKKGYATFITQD